MRRMLKKRGGQVTIFIILALIVVIAGAVVLHLRSLPFEEQEFVEPRLVPVKGYVESCIYSVAERGIRLLGAGGGYIRVPERITTNPRSYLAIGPELKNPYWWYDGVVAAPSEDYIISQLEYYIEDNLKRCIDGFSAFGGEYQINALRDLQTEIVLTNNDVLVNVNYPIEIFYRLNKTKMEMENFKQVIPIRLKKIFEMAKTIMERENRDFFLEKKTIDLMTMNRDIPTTDIEATCSDKSWNLQDVKNKLKFLLAVNLPFIRIMNGDYQEGVYVPTPEGKNIYENSYFQHHYIWEISDEIYKDTAVSFSYDESWPFDIDARPRDGMLLKSNNMRGREILNWLCLHIWHFTYDIAYPVKVTIADKETEKHKGYVFNFAFKASIDHNQPKRESFAHVIFEDIDRGTNEEYCNDLYDEVTIYTMADTASPYDLSEVDLTMTCGAYTCPLGTSEYLSLGAAAGITKKTPYCVNAVLKGKKEGFEDAEMFIKAGAGGSYTLNLRPVKEFSNYRIVKHPLVDPGSEEKLKATETVSINIKAKDTDFESFGVYPIDGEFPIKLLADKEHTYDVTIYVVEGDDMAGGYKAEWTVGPGEIENANEIVFHVLDQGFVSEEERFLFLTGLGSYSSKIPKPELR